MSATNPGKVEAWTEPVSGVKQPKDLVLGAMSIQEPSAVNISGGAVLGALLAGKESANITEAGAINPDVNYVGIVGPAASTYAVTLAAPNREGQLLVIEMLSTTGTNAVTLALTNVVGQSSGTSASFDAAGETLVLISISNKWVVLKEKGVTMS